MGKLLAAAKLPSNLDDRSEGFAAARSLLGFLELAARSQGIPELGWQAVRRARVDQLGGWGPAVARGETLRQAIGRLCRLYPREVSFVELGLTAGHEHAWLWRKRPDDVRVWSGQDHGEQWMLGAMIQVVRLVAGPRWMPPVVRLESPASTWILEAHDIEGTRTEFGGPVMAIAVPFELLDRPMQSPGRIGDEPPERIPPTDFAGSLREAISPLLSEQPLTIELGAEFANTSPRSLRRRLTEEGTSWRCIVDRVRREASQQLMHEPGMSLADIASRVGYTDQAHFSRSFKRWTGETPYAYRRRRS